MAGIKKLQFEKVPARRTLNAAFYTKCGAVILLKVGKTIKLAELEAARMKILEA